MGVGCAAHVAVSWGVGVGWGGGIFNLRLYKIAIALYTDMGYIVTMDSNSASPYHCKLAVVL